MNHFDSAADDFWYFVKVLIFFAGIGMLALLAWVAISVFRASSYPGDSRFHPIIPAHLSADLMPGQGWTVQNSEYTNFEIHSEYPVSVQGGNCYFPRGADIRLNCAAANIQITDTRPALLVWAHANHVSLTAR